MNSGANRAIGNFVYKVRWCGKSVRHGTNTLCDYTQLSGLRGQLGCLGSVAAMTQSNYALSPLAIAHRGNSSSGKDLAQTEHYYRSPSAGGTIDPIDTTDLLCPASSARSSALICTTLVNCCFQFEAFLYHKRTTCAAINHYRASTCTACKPHHTNATASSLSLFVLLGLIDASSALSSAKVSSTGIRVTLVANCDKHVELLLPMA